LSPIIFYHSNLKHFSSNIILLSKYYLSTQIFVWNLKVGEWLMRSAHQVVNQIEIARIINAHPHYQFHIVKHTGVNVVIDLNQPQPIKSPVQDPHLQTE